MQHKVQNKHIFEKLELQNNKMVNSRDCNFHLDCWILYPKQTYCPCSKAFNLTSPRLPGSNTFNKRRKGHLTRKKVRAEVLYSELN